MAVSTSVPKTRSPSATVRARPRAPITWMPETPRRSIGEPSTKVAGTGQFSPAAASARSRPALTEAAACRSQKTRSWTGTQPRSRSDRTIAR